MFDLLYKAKKISNFKSLIHIGGHIGEEVDFYKSLHLEKVIFVEPVKQFADDTKLLVTTIQKLNNAIGSSKYEDVMLPLMDKRIVFIFDECHRTQFGETHNRIKKFFANNQLFGFTGTPIFADNAIKNFK